MRHSWGLTEEMPDSGVQMPSALVFLRFFCLILASSSFRLHQAPLGLVQGGFFGAIVLASNWLPKCKKQKLTAQLRTAQDRLTFEKFRWSKLSAGPSQCPALNDNVSYYTTAWRLGQRWWCSFLNNVTLWVCAISGSIFILIWAYLFGR